MIYLYNDLTQSFLLKVQNLFKEILHHDFKIQVERKRFLYNRYFYPINFAIFEHEKTLAYFDAKYFQLGLSKRLIFVKKSILKDILRHEMLHYLTFIHHGLEVLPHGPEFVQMGHHFHLKDYITEPTLDLEATQNDRMGELESEKILNKVKKLLALGSSLNSHEAELATLKAQELLIRHQLSFESLKKIEDLFVMKVYRSARKNAKLLAIYEIIQFFMIHPVLISGKGEVSIEIVGRRAHIELAQYVVTFLDRTLDDLWKNYKNISTHSSLRAKNSFFQGIAEGYSQKMKSSMNNLSKEDEQALVKMNTDLKSELKRVYSRLGHSRSCMGIDDDVKRDGFKAGKQLSVHPATTTSQSSTNLLK